jgi:hypothetical protein
MSFSLHVPVPAVRGHFGRDSLYTFQTQVQPEQIVDLLGHDPRHENWKRLSPDLKEIYEKVQRKTSKSRRESVEGYLEDRLLTFDTPGAFPAICIGMTNPPEFEEGADLPDVGKLKLDLGPRNTRIVLDGLGRVAGSLVFLETTPEAKGMFTLPTTIFAPHERLGKLSLLQLGQLFFDFNFRATPISRSHALSLDQSDIYLVLTNQLGKREVITKHGGMETGRQSLGSKSTGLVVQAVLLRFVRGACEGAKFQKSNNATVELPNLTRDNIGTVRENLEMFLETLAEHMGQRFRSRDSLHLSSVGWQALGLAAHDLFFRLPNLDSVDRTRVISEIASIDWSRSNKDMVKIGVLTIVDGEVGMSGRGVAAVGALHEYIRANTSLGKKLPKQESQVAADVA